MHINFNIIMIIIGILLLIVGIYVIIKDKRLRSTCTATANAIVKEVKSKTESDSEGNHKMTYTPVLEFYANGQTVITKGNLSTNEKGKYKPGDECEIIYNPVNPQLLFMDKDKKIFIPGVITAIIGVAIAVFYCFSYFKG